MNPTPADDGRGADKLEMRVRSLLGLPADGPLHCPPDCCVQRYRPGQRVFSHENPGPGLQLVVVLHGMAVVKVGRQVIDRIEPGGCIGGAQFILQVTSATSKGIHGDYKL